MLTNEMLDKIEQDAAEGVGRPCYANCDPQTIAELVKMARRYACVREKFDVPRINTPPHDAGYYTPEELDTAVDQTIAGEKDA